MQNSKNSSRLSRQKDSARKGTHPTVRLSLINKGEVVGLTGLLGSGRSELVRAIYGADKPDTGKLKGKRKRSEDSMLRSDAMKLGMAYLPEDRKKDGIIADLSVRENIIIALTGEKEVCSIQ